MSEKFDDMEIKTWYGHWSTSLGNDPFGGNLWLDKAMEPLEMVIMPKKVFTPTFMVVW